MFRPSADVDSRFHDEEKRTVEEKEQRTDEEKEKGTDEEKEKGTDEEGLRLLFVL